MITANALICGKKIQLIVIKIMSLGYIRWATINITEPAYTDPYVRWCGRKLIVRSAPIPIASD
ncbi:hypothetical protein [Symbiopectobacterium sp. RP]|uniref:hypothetical protein n=1 Tax=Symbiopectobacterium sp. RP TaxID=3248553 RepID=UPI003D2BFCC0